MLLFKIKNVFFTAYIPYGSEGWLGFRISNLVKNPVMNFGEIRRIQLSKSILLSTAVGQAVTCAPVSQRARVRSPVGISFLGEVFLVFFSPVRQMSGSFRPPRSRNIIWPSLSSIIIHYGRQWPEMLTRPKTSNIHTFHSPHLHVGDPGILC